MSKRLYILFQIFFMALYVSSKEVPIKVSAPKQVSIGEKFRISYEISSNDIQDFRAPDFNGFHLIDRQQSTSSTITNLNGNLTTKTSTSISYILEAYQEGYFTISPAIIHVENNKQITEKISIHVTPSSSNQSNTQSPLNQNQQINQGTNSTFPSVKSTKDNHDLFVKAIVSKQRVYEQEAILLTYKIYTSTNAYGFQGKLPVLDGFLIQETDIEQNQKSETYNGRQYMTAIWKQYVLYPQLIGECEIPPITCEATVVSQDGYLDPFGMFPRTKSSIKKTQTTPIKIEVLPLPEAPKSYCGAVGNFTISSSINKTKLHANDVLSVKVNINGKGNFKLMDTPHFTFPNVFETYDTKVTDNYHLTANGNEGSKSYEFIAVPRENGHFTIPAMDFSFFNPDTHSYQTLSTQSFNVDVNIGKTISGEPSEVTELNKDIRFIKTGPTNLRKEQHTYLYSLKWILAYICLLLVFSTVFYWIRYHNASITTDGIKGKKANIKAMQQFKKVKSAMETHDRDHFYEELLNVIYTYTENKFNIKRENQNQDNIRSVLESHKVESQLVQEYIDLIKDCEFARFAPSINNMSMEDYYEKSIQLIRNIEAFTK